jgi:uncharacterized protein (DUF302 family)
MAKPFIRFLITMVFACSAAAVHAAAAEVVVRSAKGEFNDIKERVTQAIETRGLVLNYTAHVGDMLERTGKDIGRTRQVYAKAEVLEFCSAALSRDTMEADPRNIAFCPYAIAIYALPKEPGKVFVSYRKPGTLGPKKSVTALRAVEKLLDEIVREALR